MASNRWALGSRPERTTLARRGEHPATGSQGGHRRPFAPALAAYNGLVRAVSSSSSPPPPRGFCAAVCTAAQAGPPAGTGEQARVDHSNTQASDRRQRPRRRSQVSFGPWASVPASRRRPPRRSPRARGSGRGRIDAARGPPHAGEGGGDAEGAEGGGAPRPPPPPPCPQLLLSRTGSADQQTRRREGSVEIAPDRAGGDPQATQGEEREVAHQ